MSSPANWQIVGYSDDPIPDDPGVVASQIDHIRSVAAAIGAQVDALPGSGSIDALVWRSQDHDTSEQFRQKVAELPNDLSQLQTRYVKVANALEDFHSVLTQTKGQAQAHLTLAIAAHQDIQNAQNGVQQMNDHNQQAQHLASVHNQQLKPGETPAQPAPWTGPDYPALLADAQRRFNTAKGNIDAAVTHFRTGSATAAGHVNNASNDGLKNKSHGLFGSIGHFFSSVGSDIAHWAGDAWHGIEKGCHWIATHVPLKAISALLGKIALVLTVLSFIPVIGQVADVLATACAVGMLLCDAISAINDAYEGDFTWQDGLGLGLDAVGVFVGVKGDDIIDAVSGLKGADEAVTSAKSASKEADEAATAAKADRLGKENDLKSSENALNAAKSGLKGKVNQFRGLFGKGPLPAARNAVKAAGDNLDASMKAERQAADAASQAAAKVKAAEAAKTTLEHATPVKLLKLGYNSGKVALGAGGISVATSTEDLPPAHGPIGVAKNVVVNSTKLEWHDLVTGHDG